MSELSFIFLLLLTVYINVLLTVLHWTDLSFVHWTDSANALDRFDQSIDKAFFNFSPIFPNAYQLV